MDIQTKLVEVATLWVGAHDNKARAVSLETLSSRATSDGKLFRRLAADRPILVPTAERVLSYLADANNWPTGVIPQRALHVLQSPLFQAEMVG